MKTLLASLFVAFAALSLSGCGGDNATTTQPMLPPAPDTTTLVVAKDASMGNTIVAPGRQQATLGVANFGSTGGNGTSMTNIEVLIPANLVSYLTNLAAVDSDTGTMLSTVTPNPATTSEQTVTFFVPNNGNVKVRFVANVLSNIPNGLSATLSIGANTTSIDAAGNTISLKSATPLQTVTFDSGSLTVTVGDGDAHSQAVIAGGHNLYGAQFTFHATDLPRTIKRLGIKVPSGTAYTIKSVTISYKDMNGASQTETSVPAYQTGGPGEAFFADANVFVPSNDAGNLNVYYDLTTVDQGAFSGALVNFALDGANFEAVDGNGMVTAQINGGNDLSSGATFVVRKTLLTLNLLSTGGSNVEPLCRFSVTADPAGPGDWAKITCKTVMQNAQLFSGYVIDETSGQNILDSYTSLETSGDSVIIDLRDNQTQPQFQHVPAGSTKTYAVYGAIGTNQNWSIAVSLLPDPTPGYDSIPNEVMGNLVWSDSFGWNHSYTSADWFNGYGLKNFSQEVVFSDAMAPACALTATPAFVVAGQPTTLSWTTKNVASFSIDNGVGPVVPVTSGSVTVTPTAPTTYTGTAYSADGSVATCSVEVGFAEP